MAAPTALAETSLSGTPQNVYRSRLNSLKSLSESGQHLGANEMQLPIPVHDSGRE